MAAVRSLLPIEPLLPELLETLRQHGRLVLQAPPGAGKTTRVPLALAEQMPWSQGKVLVLDGVIQLTEKDTQTKLNDLYKRNLYPNAISLAHSSNCQRTSPTTSSSRIAG